MRPVRRAGWVLAESCAPAANSCVGLVCAQARGISASLSFSVVGISSFLSPPHSATRRGAWKCNTGPWQGGCLPSSLFKPLQRRPIFYVPNRSINPAHVGAMLSPRSTGFCAIWDCISPSSSSMRCCKDPCFLNPTPRFAHRLFLVVQ